MKRHRVAVLLAASVVPACLAWSARPRRSPPGAPLPGCGPRRRGEAQGRQHLPRHDHRAGAPRPRRPALARRTRRRRFPRPTWPTRARPRDRPPRLRPDLRRRRARRSTSNPTRTTCSCWSARGRSRARPGATAARSDDGARLPNLCTAPCDTQVPPGQHRLALSLHGGHVVEAEDPVEVRGPSTVQATTTRGWSCAWRLRPDRRHPDHRHRAHRRVLQRQLQQSQRAALLAVQHRRAARRASWSASAGHRRRHHVPASATGPRCSSSPRARPGPQAARHQQSRAAGVVASTGPGAGLGLRSVLLDPRLTPLLTLVQ